MIADFVTLFQKTNKKDIPEETIPEENNQEVARNDENSENPEKLENSENSEAVGPPESICDSLDEEKSNTEPIPEESDKNNLDKNEDNFENYLSPAPSSKESLANSLNNYDSSFSLSQENTANESVRNGSNSKNEESCKSPTPSSKNSILNGREIDEKSDRSQSPSSRESMSNHLFEFEENEDPIMAQGIEGNAFGPSHRIDYDLSSDNDYY